MSFQEDFPRLHDSNYRTTSPASRDYNCIAWCTGDTGHWWQPDVYWPTSALDDDFGIGVLAQVFTFLGYEYCADGGPESGFEKVALFGSGLYYTHAARQLTDGKWTSKLGGAEDVEHSNADDVGGGLYGEVVQYMRRPVVSGTA